MYLLFSRPERALGLAALHTTTQHTTTISTLSSTPLDMAVVVVVVVEVEGTAAVLVLVEVVVIVEVVATVVARSGQKFGFHFGMQRRHFCSAENVCELDEGEEWERVRVEQ